MGKKGALAPLWKCCKVFLCISSFSKTFSKGIIYALFSQPVVIFWGKGAKTPTGVLFLDPLEYFRPQTLICPPLKKILRAPMIIAI